jgi:hypothetical protein
MTSKFKPGGPIEGMRWEELFGIDQTPPTPPSPSQAPSDGETALQKIEKLLYPEGFEQGL